MNRRKCELLTLRKPTKVDELINSVPKPRNAVPKHGLPLWEHLPLGSKLPVLNGPKRELVFTRDKIGRKLWQNATQTEFILSDPNCLDVSYNYDSLHDENLRLFYKNKVNRNRMVDLGLVTKQGDAICSLKDYNNYRRYLRRVHQEAINVERVKMEEKGMERFLLRKAKQNEERDLMAHARKRNREAKMKRVQVVAEGRQAKLDQLVVSQKEHAARLEMIAAKKEEDRRRLIEKAIAFSAKIRQRNQQAQDIERKRKIKALRKWHDIEVTTRKRLTKEKWRKIMEKELNEYHHLHQKIKCQVNRLDRQQQLLDHYQSEMAIRAKLRSKYVEYQRLKMEDKFMKNKAERVRGLSDNAWSVKAMVNALCKAWENKLKHKTPEQKKEEKILIEKTIQLQMAEYKNKSEGKEVLAILQGAKMKLEKLFGVPEPVSVAVDYLLNNSIVTYVNKKVDLIISDTAAQAEVFRKQYEAVLQEHRRKKMLAMKAQLAGTALAQFGAKIDPRASIRSNAEVISMAGKTRSLTTTGTVVWGSTLSVSKPQRLVSFGTIMTIDKVKDAAGAALDKANNREQAIPEDMLLVRRTKDRPPTPVPSLTELVDAAFHDPIPHENLWEADVERNSLDMQLSDFAKKLLKLVLKKADMKVEGKRKQLYRQLSGLDLDTETIVAGITDAILFIEEPNLMKLPEVEHISDVLAKDVIVKRAAYIFTSTLPIPTVDTIIEKSSNTKIVKKLVLMDK